MRTMVSRVVLAALVCAAFAGNLLAVCPAGPPVLVSPGNGAQVTAGNVVLNWNPVSGATDYQVFLALDGDPPALQAVVTATQYIINVDPGRSVQWKIVATAPSCASTVSPIHTFTTACPNVQPLLRSPDPGDRFEPNQNVTFNWTAVPGATSYDVNVTADFGATHVTIAENITSTQFTKSFPKGDYGWHVRVNFDGSCPPLFSQPSYFLVDAQDESCPANPGKATLIAPAANATNLTSPVTFSWNAVPGALGYRVLAYYANSQEPVTLGITVNTSLSARVSAGTGAWVVQSFFGENCATTLSERRAFTVTQGASCNTTPPALLSPAANAQNTASRVTFKWSAVTDAVGYELYVATGGSNDFQLYGATGATTTELERFVPRGVVDWYVVARFGACPDVRSATSRFGAAEVCPTDALQLVSPANGAEVTSPVALQWSAVAGATEYRITLRTEQGADSLVLRSATTTTSVRLPAGKFLWRVEALRGECTTSSQERSFTVRTGTNCSANTAPALVSPAGTATDPAQAQSPVTFQWTGPANALAYRLYLSRNGQPFEDAAFTTVTNKTLELEPGRYAWFVNALFEACEPTRSPVAYFVIPDTTGCSTTAPAIIAPAAGQTVTSNVTFTWSAVQGADKYRLFIVVEALPVLLGTTDETQLTRILPPDTYTYAVEAVFEKCPSRFSPRTTFTVARSQSCVTEAPQLSAPANNSTTTEQETELVWAPVSGAIRYAVAAKLGDGAETIIGTTEDTRLTRVLPPGRIEWHAIAFFGGCDPRTSQTFSFTITRPQNCGDRKPVLLFPEDEGTTTAPVQFAWIGVPRATEYRVWLETDEERPSIVATTTNTNAKVNVPAGTYRWFVEARFENCPPAFSARGEFSAGAAIACGTPRKPDAHVIGQALSATQYRVRWTPLANVSLYEVQEATHPDFTDAQTFVTEDVTRAFAHEVTGAPVRYLYRVRGRSSCNDTPGPYSDVVGVYVIEPKTNNASTELGSDGPVVQKIFLPGGDEAQQFTATVDKPWLTVTPAAGTIPFEGVTLNVTADPTALNIGTNTGTVQVIKTIATPSGGGVSSHASSTTSNFPTSVSLVTPVEPTGKGTPPPDALIFGAVGHASGVNDSLFESDIRLTNLSAQTMKYDLNFTPSGVDGTQEGASSTIEVAPNATVALDDVVASMFGSGTVGSSLGMLEVRPITTSSSSGGLFGSIASAVAEQIHTAASSRTYNFTPNGTFGQYIPATPFSQFVGRNTILSLQQVAQSTQFRANFGFLEASGAPVELIVRVYDVSNTLLATIPVSLGAMQHRQINGMLQNNGINDLADGRVEVEVLSGDGKVTAYVSEVDNETNDPLLVSPVVKGATRADRYVVPGMAYINTGSAFWVTDLRIFNADDTPTAATLTFYPMGNPSGAISREIALGAGEIEVLNNVLVNLFGVSTDAGGSVVITTPEESALTATARTYNQTEKGTYGQYIPGVTVADSVGLGDRALQVLQVEQSSRFRTNVGVNETSGKPVTIEVSLITPDQLATPVVTIGLQANEFRQIGLVDFALTDAVYNGRVTVKVIAGEGKVTAYGSAIDSKTQDPTYVPAQ
jgi:hypothetical protein